MILIVHCLSKLNNQFESDESCAADNSNFGAREAAGELSEIKQAVIGEISGPHPVTRNAKLSNRTRGNRFVMV